MKSFAPRRTNCKGIVEWLPPHPKFRNDDIGVVASKILETARGGEVKGVQTRSGKARSENRQIGFGVEGIGFSARVRKVTGNEADDIACNQRVVRFLLQSFP